MSHDFLNFSSLNHPLKSYPSFVGGKGAAIVSPYITLLIFETVLPPFELKVTVYFKSLNTHLAYNIVSDVTTSVAKSHLLIQSASLYQPSKIYPSFVGILGSSIVLL